MESAVMEHIRKRTCGLDPEFVEIKGHDPAPQSGNDAIQGRRVSHGHKI